MIEAKFTHQQAAVIVAAVIQHQDGIPPLDPVLANILEDDIYGPIIGQLDAGFEDAEAIRRVSERVAAEAQYSPSDLASAMSALTREEALEIASRQRTIPETFPGDLVPEEEPDSGSNPAENGIESDGQSPGQKDPVLLKVIAKKPEMTASEVLVAEAKESLRQACHEALNRTGISSIRALSQAVGFSINTLGNYCAPSTKMTVDSLAEVTRLVEAYGRTVATPATGQRVFPATPGETVNPKTAIILEPERMAQAILAIARYADNAAAASEVGLVLPSSRAIAVIRAECTEWISEARSLLEATLPPSAQRDRRIALQEKIRNFASQRGGERIVVLMDPVETPDLDGEDE